MNKALRRETSFGPYLPFNVEDHPRAIFVHRPVPVFHELERLDQPSKRPDDISAVFDALTNLRKMRSSILEPVALDSLSLEMAERIVAKKKISSGAPDKASIEQLASELSKFID